MLAPSSCLALGLALTTAAGAGAQTLPPGTIVLDHDVADVEYSEALDRLVSVSTSPTAALHVVDPLDGIGASRALDLAPTCVSVAPDGLSAAVGHDGRVSWIDLQTLDVLASWPVPAAVGDVVLAGNGFAYAFPESGQWTHIECLELATGAVTQHVGNLVREGTRARLHPGGDWIYGADNGVFPPDIEKYDVSGGTAVYLYDSPYHGSYAMDGDLWFSADGARLHTRGGDVFGTSVVEADDMLHQASTPVIGSFESVAELPGAGVLLAIPTLDDTRVQLHDGESLLYRGVHELPTLQAGSEPIATHGRHVFAHSDGVRALVVLELDEGAPLARRWGVEWVEPGAIAGGLGTHTLEITLTFGGTQELAIDAGREHAGRPYVVLGTLSGTTPGLTVGDVTIPLNADPVYFPLTATASISLITNAFGSLDSAGRASAAFTLPGGLLDPGVNGVQLHHAYVVFGDQGPVVFASNAVPLLISL